MLSSVYTIKSIFSTIFYSIYGAVWFQLPQFSSDDRENAYFILLSSSKLTKIRSWSHASLYMCY